MHFDTQPLLQDDRLSLLPLNADDFEALYAAASDPEVWMQHPNRDRWKRDVFRTFFEGAMESGGAFKIVARDSGIVIGSTRIYDYDADSDSVFVGYTFYAKQYWGTGVNPAVKAMMLDYLFQFVATVRFHIGAGNVRSQIAIGRLGAEKVAEQEVTYYGESPKLNFEYQISKGRWAARKI